MSRLESTEKILDAMILFEANQTAFKLVDISYIVELSPKTVFSVIEDLRLSHSNPFEIPCIDKRGGFYRLEGSVDESREWQADNTKHTVSRARTQAAGEIKIYNRLGVSSPTAQISMPNPQPAIAIPAPRESSEQMTVS
jgi:hypothetical protein